MSKYCKIDACLKLTNLARLKEALRRAWKLRFNITLEDKNIEIHKEAVPLMDYRGTISEKKAHVIIRGSAMKHQQSVAEYKSLNPGVELGENRHPGLNNDFGLIDTDGSGLNLEAEVDDQIQDVVKIVKLYETALGIESHIKKRVNYLPGTVVKIQGKKVKHTEIADTIVQLTQKKINPLVEVVNTTLGEQDTSDFKTSKGKSKGMQKPRQKEFE